MGKEQESTASNYLVPSSGHALARRSDALVNRGIRDLEAVEQMEVNLRKPLAEAEKQRTERILVVDDEEAIRDIIASILTSAGYECRAVAGGLDALALLESGEEFELLVTDLLNSPLTGLDLLLRTKEKFPEIQVVVASAVNDEDAIRACIRSGAYEYLVEPFERKQLLVTVSRALEDRRMRLESHKQV
jgi:DNA-binding NtrC family response regulator